MDSAVAAERERCASIADDLAARWQASAGRLREKHKRRFFFGFGSTYVPTIIERQARDIESAASGVRAISLLIRNGARRR
jgi:hypothetical protein